MSKRYLKKSELQVQDLLLQPWYLPRRAAFTILKVLPPHYQKRMRDFFDDYGCMRCDRRNVAYRSNGFCDECAMLIYRRMTASANRRLKDRPRNTYGAEFVNRAKEAKKLLRGVCRRPGRPRAAANRKSGGSFNPVVDALE